ncbi:nucleotidyltransferase domain-containing protein [Tenacibaculum maritimum]|uniref:nucleotidyltransferase domain-containing protein n=1 Tax=Tenacibaculum maritimum TaxID=107401 RepID=UPI001E2FBA61|nr:nucleotidyltransferase domain-containing protein [Tenacibaculum maritimum]MCD9561887.1 nucleotidyltransferase domain-containing protein [Tenacibaculum maritimum]MCD9564999.1 nucleotidyltransferase domain-containing protein [Tenacibaculum maritimum]MCD9578972.1 nucleotidyltransferase domain-containing protein [Tenacibaculum maritimum]MCD9580854.1 nucleotidyltransferase domain-containing protein [Tenacibaculum maritimum]MCD9595826.1 nucleotidyltransferase domain-containing protein [Tenacibacu
MYVYAFGSICRGEIDRFSDIDLLIITESNETNKSTFDTNKFSIYKKERILELWKEGNPFAWHLYTESKLLFSDDQIDLIKNIGPPNKYINLSNDLEKFHSLYKEALFSLNKSSSSVTFDLSMIFLAIRNFSSCYSLGFNNSFQFSRDSALKLKTDKLNISFRCYEILKRARILSTRGIGDNMIKEEVEIVKKEISTITNWFDLIKNKTCKNLITESNFKEKL